jgi:hypothetical protein
MQIIEEDLVDWEPLRIRFLPESRFADPQLLAAEIANWCKTNATKKRSDCDIRYWEVISRNSAVVEVVCEHLTKKALGRLLRDVAKQCPDLERIVIGEHLEGCPDGVSFDWALLPAAEIDLDGTPHSIAPIAISFTPVTIGQFVAFIETTGYTPIPDRIEYEGYLVSHFQLNHGKSPKLPLFGVTYDDAVAYCDWVQLRLPTEPELHHFFVSLVREGRKFTWSGECWTTTSPAADVFVVRNGPYRMESLNEPVARYRKELHRHHYQYLEAPCFRVARTREGATEPVAQLDQCRHSRIS